MKVKKVILAALSLALACGIGFGVAGCNGGNGESGAVAGDIIVISREEGSGTRGAFVELTGIEAKNEQGEKVDRTISSAVTTNSTNVVLTTIMDSRRAIGYVSMGSLNDKVKALKYNGVEPTTENVLAGTYKLARPFNIATKKGAAANDLRDDFIKFIYSNEGQKIVTKGGYIALKADDGNRTGAYTAPASLTQKSLSIGGSSSVSPLMDKLIESYKKLNSGVTIDLQTSDSTNGMKDAAAGRVDIGMASRELKESEKGSVDGKVIAQDGIAVIVHKDNVLDTITQDQVCKIYIGEITKWEQVSAK